MKKITLLFSIILILGMSSQIFAQFTTDWEKSSGASSLPAWFSASNSTERGFGYGLVGGNERLYVVSRNGGTFVKIVDATDGSDVGDLDMTGVSGGTFTLNDADVSDDGIIFACNLTTNSTTSGFKVYRWDNEAAAPVMVIDYTNAAAERFGDKFTVTGSASDNSLIIHAVSGNSATVVAFTTADNGATFTPNIVTLSDGAPGGSPSAVPIPGGFYVNANGINPKEYDATGTFQSSIPGTVISTGSNAIRYIEEGSVKLVVSFQYGSGNERALVADVSSGNATSTLFGATNSLGANGNANGVGDVAVRDNGDATYTIFVLGTNNGFGSYTTTNPVPVELTSFTYSLIENNVNLSWTTATEINNLKFEVERSNSDQTFVKIGEVQGAGTSSQVNSYNFTDASVDAGAYTYRLKQIDFDGTFEYSNSVEVVVGAPQSFGLSQNYPNPFNPSTVIEFAIPEASNVKLIIYNMLGQEVATLINRNVEAGTHRVNFDASGLNSGVYIYKLEAADFVQTNKMTLMK
jgi:hypothetical protein